MTHNHRDLMRQVVLINHGQIIIFGVPYTNFYVFRLHILYHLMRHNVCVFCDQVINNLLVDVIVHLLNLLFKNYFGAYIYLI